jgi:UDP-glucose 4-epimerase
MPAIANGRFVLIGGASQVACAIAEQLLVKGASEIVLLDNLSLGSAETIETLLADSRCRFVRADMLKLNELFDPLDGADGVFSVAGIMASTIRDNPWLGIDVNVRGLQNILEACRICKVGKVVHSSSVGIYGMPAEGVLEENTPFRWQGMSHAPILYGASKIMGEALLQLYRDRYGIEFVALRYSAVYGERQHRRAVVGGHIAETCERISRGQSPFIDGDGSQVQDYIYVGDLARANLMAMESTVSGEAFNIVGGEDVTQIRIVEMALNAAGSDLPVERRDIGFMSLPPTKRFGYSREKAKRVLSWQPDVSLEKGIARVLRWVKASTA